MIAFDIATYQPVDALYLWWLADPAAPRLIGELRLARTLKGVSLIYSPGWLESGFPLSEDLPLVPEELFPKERETAAGAVDDARPDRWGERLIRFLDKPPRTSVLDFLFYAGDERFGALGVSISPEQYIARATGPLPQLADAIEMESLVRQVLAGEQVDEGKRRLITPGTTLGGARPKALLTINSQPWVLKFNEPGELDDMSLIEHATMTLAVAADIRVAQTLPVKVRHGHAIAVQRFDRAGTLRRHALSANVALKAAGDELGYPELAQLLRRRGMTARHRNLDQMKELFRRMVFNILVDNTDDHEKNHVVLMNAKGEYELSPAFDVLPSAQSLGFQQMRVGTSAADSTLDNAMSEHGLFGLTRDEAYDQIKKVCAAVRGWKDHFVRLGVNQADIATLERQIDRPFLSDQRGAFA